MYPDLYTIHSLFILGLSESNPPHFLEWLMTPDLVHIFFRVVFQTSLPYRTDELKEPAYAHQYEGLGQCKFSPVTGYRLMTGMTVSLLGLIKAYLAYRNVPWNCRYLLVSTNQ